MANMAHQLVSISGSTDDLESIRSLVAGEEEVFDFTKIDPAASDVAAWEDAHDDDCAFCVSPTVSTREEDGSPVLEYFYDTRWRPAIEILRMLSERFPFVRIEMCGHVQGLGVPYEATFSAGRVLHWQNGLKHGADAEWIIGPDAASYDSRQLFTMIRERDSDFRAAAVELLGRRDSAEVAPIARALLSETDSEVRLAVMAVLAAAGGQGCVADFIGLLGDGDPVVRDRAFRTVGEFGDAAAILPMCVAMDETMDYFAFWDGVSSILGRQSTLQAVQHALSNDPVSRAGAGFVLAAEARHGSAHPLLKRLLRDPSPVVRMAARGELGDIPEILNLRHYFFGSAAPDSPSADECDPEVAPTVAWAARECYSGRGRESRDYYQAEPRRVNVLGSLDPQLGGWLIITLTGDWSWADGSLLLHQIEGRPWDDYVPAGVEDLLLYAVGDHAFPSRLFWGPTAHYRRSERGNTVLHRGLYLGGSWSEELLWQPCATVTGEEFMRKGLAAFYPELIEWGSDEEERRS